ncbi:MAG: hypothetical protein JOZ57_18290, partial [Abitibacteriaceae bacterium]|nr:hypothetical protein [Abditibacteriaceae bacterium]
PYSLIADSRFQLDPSWQALKIRARLRGHNITVGNQIWMTAHIAYDFDDKDGNKVESGPTRFLGLRQDSDWVTQEITARIPAGATFLRLKPGLFRVKGTFDIADLDISEVTLPASLRALAIRPGFPEGTFEQFDNQHNPLGWKLPDPVQMKVLTENGNHFLRLTNDTSLNSVSLESRFQLDPRWQAIKVRVRMRTSDLNPGPNPQDRAQLRFDFSDTNQQKVGPGHTVPTLKGDSDWTTLESKVLVPQGAAFITLIPGLFHTTGTLDVDDISIEEVKTQ